ncbi:MAG: aldo/keto reductase [Thermoanaerobaculia bacterium]|jgi:aryl-alcohol dehydrogenase-like predicted oxidoreductase
MRRVRLGRTGVSVPAVSLGTWGYSGPNMNEGTSVGWTGHDDGLARDALVRAAAEGIDHWDTADVYGNGRSEELIGGMWGEVPRKDIFLATKVGWDKGGRGHFYHPDVIRTNFERSLRLLRTEVIDLYYLHHCDFGPSDEYFDDALALVRRFREEGKVRFIGLSDWEAPKIMRFIDKVDPDVVQPYRNVIDDDFAESGLRDWIARHDAGVAFFSPIMHGLLLGKYDAPVSFPEGDFRSNVEGFGDAAVIDRMKRARKLVEARWTAHPQPVLHALVGALLADAPTGCVLLGQRNPAQVASAAVVGVPLSEDEATWVRQIYREG